MSDGDDQGPAFEYQGCVRYNGACINAHYTATVKNNIKVGTASVSHFVYYELPCPVSQDGRFNIIAVQKKQAY